jgi:hypothetical protein
MAHIQKTKLSDNIAQLTDIQKGNDEKSRDDKASGDGLNIGEPLGDYNYQVSLTSSLKEVFDVRGYDPVLARKMAIVNQAIDDIGMTSFQWKLFFLNGFGYAVDSVGLFFSLGKPTKANTIHCSFWSYVSRSQIQL